MTTLITDALVYVACWAAWMLWRMIPMDTRLAWAILPWAGLYAYSDGWADYRRSRNWNRAGRPQLYGE